MANEDSRPASQTPFWQRLAWFAAIWAASVVCIGVVAFVIRLAVKQ